MRPNNFLANPCLRSRFRGAASDKLFIFAEATVIVRDGILVAGGHRSGVAATDLAILFVVQLSAQLQLELVHVSQYLRVELLNKRGIAWKTAGIQALHLADQVLNLLRHFWIFLNRLTKLI